MKFGKFEIDPLILLLVIMMIGMFALEIVSILAK